MRKRLLGAKKQKALIHPFFGMGVLVVCLIVVSIFMTTSLSLFGRASSSCSTAPGKPTIPTNQVFDGTALGMYNRVRWIRAATTPSNRATYFEACLFDQSLAWKPENVKCERVSELQSVINENTLTPSALFKMQSEKSYKFWVRAINSCGASEPAELSFTTVSAQRCSSPLIGSGQDFNTLPLGQLQPYSELYPVNFDVIGHRPEIVVSNQDNNRLMRLSVLSNSFSQSSYVKGNDKFSFSHSSAIHGDGYFQVSLYALESNPLNGGTFSFRLEGGNQWPEIIAMRSGNNIIFKAYKRSSDGRLDAALNTEGGVSFPASSVSILRFERRGSTVQAIIINGNSRRVLRSFSNVQEKLLTPAMFAYSNWRAVSTSASIDDIRVGCL